MQILIDPFLLESDSGDSYVLLSFLPVVFGPDHARTRSRGIRTFLKSLTHGSTVDIDSVYYPSGRINPIDGTRTPPIMSRQYFDLLMIQGPPNHFPWTNARKNYVQLHYPLNPIAGVFVGMPCRSITDSNAVKQAVQQGRVAGKFLRNIMTS